MQSVVPHEKIVAIVRQATREVFDTMLAMPLEDLEPRQERGEPAPINGVIALVGIGGDWTGTGRICCSAELSCRLAGAMLGMEYTAVDEDVLDAIAEVANMIIGNVKTTLEDELGPLGLSVPTVVFGRNYHARSGRIQSWTVVPFRCPNSDAGGPQAESPAESNEMDIRFSLVKTAPGRRPKALKPDSISV